jgi:hypothetical protein
VRLNLPTPSTIDTLAAHFPGDRWIVAAVERERVTLGLAGAERVYNALIESGSPPTAVTLARILGAYQYYPFRVWDGGTWTQTGQPDPAEPQGSSPMITPRPRTNGNTLTFSYWIPDGTAGAGMHLAHFHLTPSNYIIDDAPNPAQR